MQAIPVDSDSCWFSWGFKGLFQRTGGALFPMKELYGKEANAKNLMNISHTLLTVGSNPKHKYIVISKYI